MLQTSDIQRLIDLGHDKNPKHRVEIKPEDVGKLKETDTEVREMVLSYMDFLSADFDRIAMEHHGRRAAHDGEAGPAFEELIRSPRCGFPDYMEAGTDGAEEANWPTDCRGRLKVGRSFEAAPGLNKADTDKAFWAAVNNWTYAIEDMDVVSDVGPRRQDHHVYADLKALGGSTLAWSYLAQNRCDVWLQQAYNTRVNWAIDYLATVISHEQGHAWGMPHNRDPDALLYPSIHSRSVARRGFPNSTDLAQMKGLGYKLSGSAPPKLEDLYRPRPHGPTPGPEPEPEPGPNKPHVPVMFLPTENGFLITDLSGNPIMVDGKPLAHDSRGNPVPFILKPNFGA